MTKPTIDDINLCIVHTHKKQMIDKKLAALLHPVDAGTFHQYVLPPRTPVELHYHDVDEYWWFTDGKPLITLWTRQSGLREYQLEPGDMVACLRGVAHTLWADHTVTYYQFSSVRPPDVSGGHLVEGLPAFDAHRKGSK